MTGSKIILYGKRVVIMTALYAFTMWLFDWITDGVTAFDWTILIQSLVFAVIFVPIVRWDHRKKD